MSEWAASVYLATATTRRSATASSSYSSSSNNCVFLMGRGLCSVVRQQQRQHDPLSHPTVYSLDLISSDDALLAVLILTAFGIVAGFLLCWIVQRQQKNQSLTRNRRPTDGASIAAAQQQRRRRFIDTVTVTLCSATGGFATLFVGKYDPNREEGEEEEASKRKQAADMQRILLGEMCPICLSHFQKQQLICQSTNPCCRHSFHWECMEGWWLSKNGMNYYYDGDDCDDDHSLDCPVCRQSCGTRWYSTVLCSPVKSAAVIARREKGSGRTLLEV